jgi:hypothetical protein
MQGAILTQTQAASILGQFYTDYTYFNPVLDIDANIYITKLEIDNCTATNFQWVKQLTITTIIPFVYQKPV